MGIKKPHREKSIIHGQKGRGRRANEKRKPSEAVSKVEHAMPVGE